MLKYRMNVLKELADKGYTQNRIRKEKLIGQATLTQLRHGVMVSWATIETLCGLLGCDVGDLVQYVADDTQPAQPASCDPA